MIVKHQQLCSLLMARIAGSPLGKRAHRLETLVSLEQETLENFLSFDSVVGLYVPGGSYQEEQEEQFETVAVTIILGSRNFGSAEAALGVEQDFGVWDMLEEIRAILSEKTWYTATNVKSVTPLAWKNLVARSDQVIIGIEAKLVLARDLPQKSNEENQ